MARLRFQVWLDIRELQAEDLALKVGVSNQAVQRWLRHGIPRARVNDVASALKIDSQELERFVDAGMASELVDLDSPASFWQRVEKPRTTTTVATTAANNSEGKDPRNPSINGLIVNDDSCFIDRRRVVDRRRQQTLSVDTPSRRKLADRRDSSYRGSHNFDWWLKVDYLDGLLIEPLPERQLEDTAARRASELADEYLLHLDETGTL